MAYSDDIHVSIVDLPRWETLSDLWRDLEARSQSGVFLSWSWTGAWLKNVRSPLYLIKARLTGGEIIGLGLLAPIVERKLGVRYHGLVLNHSGEPAESVVHAASSDFLLDKRYSDLARRKMIDRLVQLSGDQNWLQKPKMFRFDGVDEKFACSLPADMFHVDFTAVRDCPFVDLDSLRRDGADYLDRLSRTMRIQIRRELARYESWGDLKLAVAQDEVQARDWLEDLERFQLEANGSRKTPNPFASPFFQQFVRDLVHDGCGSGNVQLIHVCAGHISAGYLLNLVKDGMVYNYQCGYQYDDHRRYKPGLLCHVMAVRHYLEQGYHGYSFLAGGDRYRKRLATNQRQLFRIDVERKDPIVAIDRGMRKLFSREYSY